MPRRKVVAQGRNNVKLIFIIFLLSSALYSQPTPKAFFDALINNKENIKDFVDESELIRAERFGITYTGVKNKFLLGNDIQENVKQEIRAGNFRYEIHETRLEDDYSSAYLVLPQLKDSLRFYFYKGRFIDASAYYTRSWQKLESKYFIFKISEPNYFNDYCVRRLDEFTEKMLDSMDFSQGEKELLQRQKIYYIFCKDEKEVGMLSGTRSKGQAMLGFDEVITAYQTHFHEVSHLLINYKLKNLGLFTLPFFMEGFAVAMGGRGGMAPRVVTDIGYYLQKSGEMAYDSILTYESFNSNDPGITYSIAGLYNNFLIEELGMKQYLEFYKKVNGDLSFVQNIKVQDLTLPDKSRFEQYLSAYKNNYPYFFSNTVDSNRSETDSSFSLYQIDRSLYEIPTLSQVNNNLYISRAYEEISKTRYRGQHYIVSTDAYSVRLYNCFNDELLVSYDLNFSLERKPIPVPYNNDHESKFLLLYLKKSLVE